MLRHSFLEIFIFVLFLGMHMVAPYLVIKRKIKWYKSITWLSLSFFVITTLGIVVGKTLKLSLDFRSFFFICYFSLYAPFYILLATGIIVWAYHGLKNSKAFEFIKKKSCYKEPMHWLIQLPYKLFYRAIFCSS